MLGIRVHFGAIVPLPNGSRSGSNSGTAVSGSVPLTNGSGSKSERPKNMLILRIRIPNTAHRKEGCPRLFTFGQDSDPQSLLSSSCMAHVQMFMATSTLPSTLLIIMFVMFLTVREQVLSFAVKIFQS